MKNLIENQNVTMLLALCVAVLTGCTEPTSPETVDVIMPLAIGNEWVGKETTYGPNDSVLDWTYRTIEIVDTLTVNGRLWYQSRIKSGASPQIEWYFNDEQGLHRSITDINETPSYPSLYLKYPAKVGDKTPIAGVQGFVPDSQGNDSLATEVGTVITLTEADFELIAPIGRMVRCQLYVRHTAQWSRPHEYFRNSRWNYYCPNIGPVRLEQLSDDADLETQTRKVWELVTMVSY